MLATTEPDRALGVVVGAGWLSKEKYGDANQMWNHDISTTYIDPAVAALLDGTVIENDAGRHAGNLAGLPVLVRVGEVDGNVPPYWSRRMGRLLQEAEQAADGGADRGGLVAYQELKGKDHWWWDTNAENDGGVNNDPAVRQFLADLIQGGAGSHPPLPDSYEISSHNPATMPGGRGVRLLQLARPFTAAGKVKVKSWGPTSEHCLIKDKGGGSQPNSIVLRTSNLRRFQLRPAPGGWGHGQCWGAERRVSVVVDGSAPFELAVADLFHPATTFRRAITAGGGGSGGSGSSAEQCALTGWSVERVAVDGERQAGQAVRLSR